MTPRRSSTIVPANSDSVSQALTPVDDDLPEGTEHVVFTVTATSDYTVGGAAAATVSIADNDVQVSVTAYAQGGTDTTWRQAGAVTVKTYVCPSDPYGTSGPYNGSLVTGNWARGNYACNVGPGYGAPNSSGTQTVGGTGHGPYPAGAPFGANFGSTMSELTNLDGTSNTIMFGEVRAGPVTSDPRGTWGLPNYGASWLGGCPTGDCYGPNDSGCCSDDVHNCSDRSDLHMGCWNGGWGQGNLRSGHSGGGNAALCDGHVAFIANGINVSTYFFLMSKNDGQSFTYP